MNADSLIFDMDGTLWDSSNTVVKAWNQVFSSCPDIKMEISAQQLKMQMGKPMLEIGKSLFPDMDNDKLEKLVKDCCQREQDVLKQEGGILYEGLEDTLRELKSRNIKLLIVSNCQEGYIESFFEYHGLGSYFDDFECAGATGKTKGENIIDIINRNNVKLAYYVGDTKIDYEATRKACIPFIYAAYGFGNVHNYEYRINSITDLKSMF